jgi:uncharacterized protein with ATP-grasp and redox domains
MTTRIPNILKSVIGKNRRIYPPEILRSWETFHTELSTNQKIQPLETLAPDGPDWAAAWQPHQGKHWLDVPWYWAESFFYRRLLEAANYFGGQGEALAAWIGRDPFLPDKEEELQNDTPWEILSAALDHTHEEPTGILRSLLHHGVWGNRVDLSYMQVAEAAGRQIAVDKEQENLLVDDTEKVLAYLKQGGRGAEEQGSVSSSPDIFSSGQRPAAGGRIDFICDNAGTELLQDLALADALLRFNWTNQIVLHVKTHPTFVSDATPADIDMTLMALKNKPGAQLLDLAGRLTDYRTQQRLLVRADLFWNSSHFFWEIPPALRADLAQAHLVIIKGDANYRRLLGDSRWPTTVPMADAVPYFPAPFVALRTLKSEPIVGLKPGQAETLDRVDPQWRVNGKRGMIQAFGGITVVY